MRILATGTEGYIGSLLPPLLVERGHEVVGVDTGYYEEARLYETPPVGFGLIHEDIRRLRPEQLESIDAVVHLAELSNDPLGQLAPTITYDVNHRGSLQLARLAKRAGAKRFVYASSCSVYGVAEEELVDEASPVRPQTAYAECKTLVERDLRALADDDFSPTFLRNATAYGASPRMRFDIVLNNLAGLAWTTGVIRMESDGTPWRPLVHAEDACRAVVAALEAPRERVHAETLNVGAQGANYRVRELAEVVGRVFEGCDVAFGDRGGDNRSYRVSFDKIAEVLPEWEPRWDVEAGARQLREIFERVKLTREDFESRDYTRLRQIQHLLSTGRIDEAFFWTNASEPTARAARPA
jgi:nucleoside-diphosphate-sugar epimerase